MNIKIGYTQFISVLSVFIKIVESQAIDKVKRSHKVHQYPGGYNLDTIESEQEGERKKMWMEKIKRVSLISVSEIVLLFYLLDYYLYHLYP